MKLIQIPLTQISESKINTRGKITAESLADMIASVKEKGVLVPIIVRPKGKDKYEVVAGNRRFMAAKTAGLQDIPARVDELSDDDAKEVQIIENLQREDVHPIEEGVAYRELIEKSKYDVAGIAARVGKSENYVRYRLFLTNLIPAVAQAFREGQIYDGHAQIIGRLSPEDQKAAIDAAITYKGTPIPVKELKDWVDYRIDKIIQNQPWLKNAEANEFIGPCTKCPPNVPTLFGDIHDGRCTDKACWEIKMKKFLLFMIEKKGAVKIGNGYGGRSGTFYDEQYTKLGNKKCEHGIQGVVKEGKNIGKVISICADPACKEHGKKHTIPDWFKNKLSGKKKMVVTEEQKKKKEEHEAKMSAAQKKRELIMKKKEAEKFMEIAKKFTWPLNENMFNVIFDRLVEDLKNEQKDICLARGWEPVKSKRSYDKTQEYDDYEKTFSENIKGASAEDKVRILVELLIHDADTWNGERKKFLEALK